MSADNIRKYIGEEIWNSYFKFCFERNPWDRMVSNYYHWRHYKAQGNSFSEFLENQSQHRRLQKRGLNLYTINGEVVVDKICFYENLTEDLEKVGIRCGLPETLILPRANASFRKDRQSYRDFLTEEQAEIIRQLSRREIDLLGYKF